MSIFVTSSLIAYLAPLFNMANRAVWFGDFVTLKTLSFERWMVVKHRAFVLKEHYSLATFPALNLAAQQINDMEAEYAVIFLTSPERSHNT